uniref:Uncharacterized protein n=1 Tax=viral metagenome TaxID=1070528 RepID=A0A6C0C7I9_9ZZZZ
MLKNLITLFFVLNAIFWGLATHSQHCNLASVFGLVNCPPHYIHLLMGVVSFVIAVYVQQRDYVNSLI